jgi:hypothetical protein
LELGPTITVRRLWAACQLSPGLSISAPCHVRPAGLSSCRASCRCPRPTGASGTALPDVRRASPLEAPRHPVLLVALPTTGLSQATGCCGHSPRSAALSRATSPLASLASCPPQPFGGTLGIHPGCAVPVPAASRSSVARQHLGPSRLSRWKSDGVRCGLRRSDLHRFATPTAPAILPGAAPKGRAARLSARHTARRTTRRRSSAAGNAIAPASRPRRGVGGPSASWPHSPSAAPRRHPWPSVLRLVPLERRAVLRRR